jgi:hypothetical protein
LARTRRHLDTDADTVPLKECVEIRARPPIFNTRRTKFFGDHGMQKKNYFDFASNCS